MREHNIRFSAVDFSGELLVTNPELFHLALFNGIGNAQAFGCGLLLVRRL
jgi:CRISPR system Cascade subunit CasE